MVTDTVLDNVPEAYRSEAETRFFYKEQIRKIFPGDAMIKIFLPHDNETIRGIKVEYGAVIKRGNNLHICRGKVFEEVIQQARQARS